VLRRHAAALHLALAVADAGSAVVVFVVLSVLRLGLDSWQHAWQLVGVDGWLAALLYGAGWTFTLWLKGLYRLRARWSLRSEFSDVAIAGVVIAIAVVATLFLFKLPDVSRLLLLFLFPVQVLVTFTSRLLLRVLFAKARERGFNLRHVLVAGANAEGQAFADWVESYPDTGLRVIGHLAGPGEPNDDVTLRRPILGRLEDIEQILHSEIVDEVAICLPPPSERYIEPITRLCEEEGRVVRIPVPASGLIIPGGRLERVGGMTILTLSYGPDRTVGLVTKRLLDVVVASLALVVFSPLLLLITVALRLQEGSPVLFRQVRIGLHGRPFRVVKFRTMGPDAEAQLDSLLEHNELAGHAFKLSHDPRVSAVGYWLRRTSLDELPQFWNVLRGEMSIVGPRPPLPREVAGYDLWHRRRLSMKPGITGLWQVAARHEEDFDRWVELDLAYIDRWSLWLDLKIMLQTVPAMLQGR
jgi:exopolysaccharide biosynthesis polyprenyl glycosylphosphotransferase